MTFLWSKQNAVLRPGKAERAAGGEFWMSIIGHLGEAMNCGLERRIFPRALVFSPERMASPTARHARKKLPARAGKFCGESNKAILA